MCLPLNRPQKLVMQLKKLSRKRSVLAPKDSAGRCTVSVLEALSNATRTSANARTARMTTLSQRSKPAKPKERCWRSHTRESHATAGRTTASKTTAFVTRMVCNAIPNFAHVRTVSIGQEHRMFHHPHYPVKRLRLKAKPEERRPSRS